ncbi:RHS repeat domain-containing protein [Tenacibaculum maritimum]
MYDEEGEQVWERSLDLNGKVINGSNAPCPFLYQGQYYDKEIELAYNRFRYYDPDDGRYISKDPIGLESREANFYSYVGDSNIEIDALGLAKTYGKKAFDKKLNITNRILEKLSGKKASDLEADLIKQGWTKSNPQAAFPDKIQHTVFTRTTKSGDTYILDYHPGAVAPQSNIHKTDYWKVYKIEKGQDVIYGRVGPKGFENFDKITDSPVFVDKVLMNPM